MMQLLDEISKLTTIFIDTAPIIYYIEDHPKFGRLVKKIVESFQSGRIKAYSSVITITEVIPKPISNRQEDLAKQFIDFLKNGKNIEIVDINDKIAETAGRLRGKYRSLKALDAIQISAAIEMGVDAFLTNDNKLRSINEIKIIVIKDFSDTPNI